MQYDTNREDVGIAVRSAFLAKGTKQRFSLFVLIVLSILFIFAETIKSKPLNYLRSFIKDSIYRGSLIVSVPTKSFNSFSNYFDEHLNLYDSYNKLKKENKKLKHNISQSDFIKLENSQLRKLIEEQSISNYNFLSSRVMLDKKSPYLNSFIINMGSNKNIKNGMTVLDGNNFIGRIVDVNFFSSRVLLVSDLNSKIPILVEPSGSHGILSGRGKNLPTIEYLPENHTIQDGDKIYTSGKEGIFAPGTPIGEVKKEDNIIKVLLFSDLNQITFINIVLPTQEKNN
jgi:rod shape-determining protein MreC